MPRPRSPIAVLPRQARGFLVAALCVAAATCRLDKLIAPPQGAYLCVTPSAPDSLVDSAALGSTARRVRVVGIDNCGGSELRWNADIKQGSPWVVVQPDSGIAGSGPPVQVIFDPTGLDTTGDYREAAVISSSAVSATLEVPLRFRVYPCHTRQITTGDTVSDTLTSADCGARHRPPGWFAQIYRFSGLANDSVSIDVSADFDAFVALDSTPTSAPSLAQADDCQGKAGNPCLYYQRLPLNTTYYIEVTSADSADSGAFEMRLARPRPPDKPSALDQRLNDSVTSVPIGATVNQTSILLRAAASDPDLGDSLHLEAEVRPVAVAFSGSNVAPGPTVANGQPAWARASGLTDKTAYHWRVRVGDNTGRFSNWDSLPGATDFVVNVPHPPSPPTSPAQSKPDGTGINVGATADTDVVVLSATVSDSDAGDLVRLQVEVKPIGTAFSNTPTDSSALVANGTIAQIKRQFGNNTNYHWQARTKDQSGLTSPTWTRFGNNAESATDFRVQLAGVPFPPIALAQFQSDGTTPIPVGGDVIQSPSVVLKSQVSDPDVGQSVRMEVEVRLVGTNFLGTPTATSPFVANGATATVTASGLINNSNYHWQARAVDSTSRSGAWVSFPLSPTNPETAPDFRVAQPPAQLVFTAQPTNAQAGAAIAPAIQVTAQDAAGAVVTNFTGTITMAIGANPGGGALSGTTTVAAVAGVATFNNLSINKAGTGFTLQASTATLVRTSNTFNITPGPTSQLVFTTQPANATAGAAIAPAVVVTAQDAFFNTTNFAGSVLIAIAANPGGGTLSGAPNPVTAVNGVASFPNLSINRPGTGYTLRASSGTLAGTSIAFNVISGPPTQLAFTVPPSSTNAGAAITPPVQVAALDALGNTATSFSGSITLAIGANPGSGTLSGTNPVAAVNGVATFSNLSINRTGNGYTLRATSGTLTAATSAAFNITAGAPQLVFTTPPSHTTAGAVINGASGVQVTARDALGNTVVTFTGSVTVAIGTNAGGGTLSGTTSVTAILGVATFPNLSINRPGTGYTLTASGVGATAATSGPFNITPGPAVQLVFTGPPSNTGAGAAITPAVLVTAQDALGNTATSFGGLVTITIADNPGGATLSGTPAVNAASGVATFSNLRLNRPGIGYTLRAGSAGLVPDTSTAFNVTSVATKLVFTTQPGTTAAGSTITPAVRVSAQDSLGNTVTGFTGNVTIAIYDNPGLGVLAGTKVQPALAGVATFSNLSINRVGNGYTLIATASGLVEFSAPFTIIPGSPAQLVFTVQPSSAPAGTTIAPPVQVSVEDAQGNVVTGYSGSVSMAIGTNPGGGTLFGTTTQPVTTGIATFSDLSIDLPGGTSGYTLQASSGALTGFISAPFFIF
jgi:hypothetical protein